MDPEPPPLAPPIQSQPNAPPIQAPSCPRCGSLDLQRVNYTWWGGILGSSLLNLTRCRACRYEFNGQTGASTRKVAIVYSIVGLGALLVIGLCFLMMYLYSNR